MPQPGYDRAPSPALQDLLRNGFLRPLIDLDTRNVGGHEHDVHLRHSDEVHVYRGGTRLLTVKHSWQEGVKAASDEKYRSQPCAKGLTRSWGGGESESDFRNALHAYLRNVRVGCRWTSGEGAVQMQWARVTKPWVPFDREAVLAHAPAQHSEVRAAHAELTGVSESINKKARGRDRWSKPKDNGREVDQLAVDSDGRLVIVELKGPSSSKDYYTPLQLLNYVWQWHSALGAVRGGVQKLLDARVAVGLTPRGVPKLSGGLRAAIGFGCDTRSPEVTRRYGVVMDIVAKHLPPGVDEIQTWELAGDRPRQLDR